MIFFFLIRTHGFLDLYCASIHYNQLFILILKLSQFCGCLFKLGQYLKMKNDGKIPSAENTSKDSTVSDIGLDVGKEGCFQTWVLPLTLKR